MITKPGPTEAELEVLNVLWEQGPCSVKDVNNTLREEKEVGYTTTLKIMQIMVDKGLAHRDTSRKKHVYEAAIPKETTQSHLLQKLAQAAFGGNSIQLAMRALGEQRATATEIEDLRKMLDEMEKSSKS